MIGNGRRHLLGFGLVGLWAALAVPAYGGELLWSTEWSNWTTIESTTWTDPPQNVEASDDFDVLGTIEQILVGGDNSCIASCPAPPTISGVWVRFYEWTAEGPGAVQYEVFVPAGDPGLVYSASSPQALDITLPTPFEANGQHFISVQLAIEGAFYWAMWVANANNPAGSHLWYRDNLAGGAWYLPDDVLGNPLNHDLYFSLYGTPSGGTDPPPLVAECGEWNIVASPDPPNIDSSRLNDVEVLAPWDVWAVGNYYAQVPGMTNNDQYSLAMHWNGSAWTVVPSPSPAPTPGLGWVDLHGVDAAASNDVWAVGQKNYQGLGGYVGTHVMALHWDGAEWTEMELPGPEPASSPAQGASGDRLFDVEAVAGDDVWLVGKWFRFLPNDAVIWPGVAMHWNGSSFEVHEPPMVSPTSSQHLAAVDAVASDDVWAVGSGGGNESYIFHWDGSTWSHVPGPTPGTANALSDVIAFAANDVWAGGEFTDATGTHALILHWDGASWTQIDSPAGGGEFAGFAPDNIFSLGGEGLAHWNGTAWTAEPLPEVVPWAGFSAIEPLGPCDLWGVGMRSTAAGYRTFTAKLEPVDANGDQDGDGVPNDQDNCPGDFNPDQADCDLDGTGDVCELTSGTAQDCNGNFTPDNCESFADCNVNDVPDECEPDCNANGVVDSCDIDGGASSDCNLNGVPDECDVFADCNGNDINDWCDINGGGSTDTNANGFPDECEALGENIATVNTILDAVDFSGGQRLPDLPGPDGLVSFREALIGVKNTPGAQTIAFNIPPGDWGLGGSEYAELRLDQGPFIVDDDGTVVDFGTQTQFTGDTNPYGTEIGIYGFQPNGWGAAAMFVTANNCTIKGLGRVMQRGYGVEINGNDNRVIGSHITGPFYAGVYITGGFEGPPATGNVVGGTLAGEGNVLSSGNAGVRVDGPAADNVIVGNVLTGSFSGVEVRAGAFNTRIGGSDPAERNVIAGAGHFGEQGFPVGDQIALWDAVETTVEGNYIGTKPDGLSAETQTGPDGIEIRDSANTVVRDNLISGSLGHGGQDYAGQFFGKAINLIGDSTGTVIQGNLIGTDANGQNPVPNASGIVVESFPIDAIPTGTLLGGPLPVDGNVIASSSHGDGIRVGFNVEGVTISGNAIVDNSGLGISLSGTGNGGQPAPQIELADTDGFNVSVTGSVFGTANVAYTVELFASAACDPSGFGEGEVFLGSTQLTTDGSGVATFDVTLPVSVPEGFFVTATATEQVTGNTSEFSACAIAVLAPCTAAPGEVLDLVIDQELIGWHDHGSGVTYDVARGIVQELSGGVPAECLVTGLSGTQYPDLEAPAGGQVFYYMVRASNECGAGPWGDGATESGRSAMCP